MDRLLKLVGWRRPDGASVKLLSREAPVRAWMIIVACIVAVFVIIAVI